MLSLLFTICMIWFVGKLFAFGLKASRGSMSYFLPGDIDWYGFGWTDVYCFSIVDCRWHCSIGNITLIMEQEEKTNEV